MAISDLPGYIQGYKFQDTASTYNSTGKYFIDQAGYSDFPASRIEITDGTPNFVAVNSTTGLELNNEVQGFLNVPIKWGGSCIMVWGAPSRMGTNGSIFPIICGANATETGNGLFYLNRVTSLNYRHYGRTAGGVSTAYNQQGDDAIYATCISIDQEDRITKGMDAGGTIVSGATVGDTNVGIVLNSTVENGDYGMRDRFGNLSGGMPDVVATSNTMIICELHFFSGVLTDAPTTDVETELTALEVIYG